MPNEPNRDEGDEATQQATAGLINEFEQMLGDIGRGGDFPMTRARAASRTGLTTSVVSNGLPVRPRGVTLHQPPSPPLPFELPPVPRLPVRTQSQTPPTASSRHVSPLPRSPLGAVDPADSEPEPGPEADGSPAEAASTDRQEGERTQINPQTRRPGMFSLFPTRSERTKAANMTASPTTSPSQGNKLSSSSPGSQPTETLAPPGLTSLEERSLSAASVASAPSSGSVSAGEDSLPRPADHLEPNNPFGYPAPPPFRHNWSNPNRRAARSAINPGASTTILGGTFSSVVVGSRPRPSVSSGVFAAPPVPVSLSPVVPDPASPPAPTRPPPPVPPSRSAPAAPLPPPIPARNPARLGQASPAPPISPKSEMRKKE